MNIKFLQKFIRGTINFKATSIIFVRNAGDLWCIFCCRMYAVVSGEHLGFLSTVMFPVNIKASGEHQSVRWTSKRPVNIKASGEHQSVRWTLGYTVNAWAPDYHKRVCWTGERVECQVKLPGTREHCAYSYCLLESIADDDDETPAATGRLRPVGPPITEEAKPLPAHATALLALEPWAFLRWEDLVDVCLCCLRTSLSVAWVVLSMHAERLFVRSRVSFSVLSGFRLKFLRDCLSWSHQTCTGLMGRRVWIPQTHILIGGRASQRRYWCTTARLYPPLQGVAEVPVCW